MWGNMAVAEEIPGSPSRSDRKTQPEKLHRGKGKKMDILQAKLGKGWRGRFFFSFTCLSEEHVAEISSIYLSNVTEKHECPDQISSYVIYQQFYGKNEWFWITTKSWLCRWVTQQLLGLFRWGPMWHVRSRPEGTWKNRPEMAGQLTPHPKVPPQK